MITFVFYVYCLLYNYAELENDFHDPTKIFNLLYILRTVKQIISCHHMKILYSTLVQLYILFGITLGGSSFQSYLRNTIALQKGCTTYKQSEYYAHIAKFFKVNVQIRNSQIRAWLSVQNITKIFKGALHTKYSISRSQYMTKSNTSCKKAPH